VNPIVISQQTTRRFVLGKQGLWPGRRWKGKKGTSQAILTCGAVQFYPKLVRTTMTLEIKDFWHEEDAPVKDVDFVNALAKELNRFANFVGAHRLDMSSIRPAGLKSAVNRFLRQESELV